LGLVRRRPLGTLLVLLRLLRRLLGLLLRILAGSVLSAALFHPHRHRWQPLMGACSLHHQEVTNTQVQVSSTGPGQVKKRVALAVLETSSAKQFPSSIENSHFHLVGSRSKQHQANIVVAHLHPMMPDHIHAHCPNDSAIRLHPH